MVNQPGEYEVVLINPPNHSFGRLKRIRKTSPPLGILYIGTYLKKKGFRVRVIDGMLEPEQLNSKAILDKNVKVAGITCTTPVVASALTIAKQIKLNNPNCTVVLGGPHASVCYEELIKNEFIDFVVVGEGEYTFETICNRIVNKTPVQDLSGIIGKNNTSNICRSEYINNLDDIPFPDRSLIPLNKYELSPINYKRKPSTPIITTRGCPFGCTFCSNPVHGKKVRYHSPEYVIEEIKYLIKEFSIRDVMFWDDTFTLNTKRVETICHSMIKEKLGITWSCAGRVDGINEDLLVLMKKAGCWQISFGVETGSERLLKGIKKRINKAQIISAFNLCAKIGIETRAFFILGIPSETEEESYKTIMFAKSIKPSYAQFSLAVPYPGSEFYSEALSEGWNPPDWNTFTTYPEDQPVYITNGRTGKELMNIQAKAIKKFYFRPSYVLDRFMHIRSVKELFKNIDVAFHLLRF